MVLNNRQLPVLGKQTPESKNRELGGGGTPVWCWAGISFDKITSGSHSLKMNARVKENRPSSCQGLF
jgi:hypothetical protein